MKRLTPEMEKQIRDDVANPGCHMFHVSEVIELVAEIDALREEANKQDKENYPHLMRIAKEKAELVQLLVDCRQAFEKIEEEGSFDRIDSIIMDIIGRVDGALK